MSNDQYNSDTQSSSPSSPNTSHISSQSQPIINPIPSSGLSIPIPTIPNNSQSNPSSQMPIVTSVSSTPNKTLNISDMDFDMILPSQPEKKTAEIPGPPGQAAQKIPYHQITYRYNFGSPEAPRYDEFTFEFPEVTSPQGLQEKMEASGRYSYSINIALPETLRREDQRGALDIYEFLYKYTVGVIDHVKYDVGKQYFDVNNPQAMFKHMVFTPMDKGTPPKPIPGAIKSTYLKVVKGGGLLAKSTLFTMPDGTPITDWSILKGVELKFVPKVHFVSTYIGQNISNQIKIISAVVTGISAINSVSTQTETIEKYKQLTSTVEDQIKNLQKLRITQQAQQPQGQNQGQNQGQQGNPNALAQDQNIRGGQMNIPGFQGPGLNQGQSQQGHSQQQGQGQQPQFQGQSQQGSFPQPPRPSSSMGGTAPAAIGNFPSRPNSGVPNQYQGNQPSMTPSSFIQGQQGGYGYQQ